MNLIVCVDNNWGIGNKGNLLYRNKEDMKFFRSKTLNKVVIMGRKTLESFPEGKPLANRINIVLSRDPEFRASMQEENIIVCQNIEELMEELKKYDKEDIFVIGGKMIYEILLEHCSRAYITKVNTERKADTTLINIDELEEWECAHISEVMSCEDSEGMFDFTFNTYERILK